MSKRAIVAIVVGVLVFASFAHACPNCVDSIAANSSTGDTGGAGSMSGGVGGSMAAGYYYSIMFMLLMLFSVTGFLVYVIWKQAKMDARTLLPDGSPVQ